MTLNLRLIRTAVLMLFGLFLSANAARAADCAQFVADITIPDGTVMSPGQTFTKQWSIKNCGTTTWSGYQALRISGVYGPSSIPVAVTSPGQTRTVSATMTAPSSAGTYRATYRMSGPVGQFGNTFWVEIVVRAATPSYCSQFVADLNVPDGTVMSPGQVFTKSWRLKNCGNTTWGSGYSAVRTAGAYGPASFGVPTAGAGANADLSASFTAPSAPGTYRATYRLSGPGGQFGVSFWVEIVVSSSYCSQFVADLSIPDGTVMSPSQVFTKSWRLKNCGNTTWGSGYSAVRTAGAYGPTSFGVPAAGPGANADLSASFTAPSAPGTYRATYRLSGPGGQFGVSFWVEIVVSSNYCAQFVADLSIPDGTVMSPGQVFTKSWRIKNCGNTTWGSGYSAVRTAGVYGPTSFSVPAAGPGTNADLSASLTAPSTPGTYRATYRMSGPGGQFGDPFWVEIVVSSTECAQFVADLSIPDGTVMSAGQVFTKSWRIKNCGNTTWSGYSAVRTAGVYGPTSFSVPAAGPGTNADLSTSLTAPSTPGTYRATYRMSGPGGQFGDPFWVEIVVQSSECAQFVADLSIPDGTVMSPGQSFTKDSRIKNCGNTTWSGYSAVRTAGVYGPASFSVPAAGPGTNADLSTSLTAPSTPGTYRATYRLSGPSGQFGDPFWVEIVVPGTGPGGGSDTTLLAPVAAGQTLTVVHGYNDPIVGEPCAIGTAPDHCGNQRYGLDLSPSDATDNNILAPLPGSIAWVSGDCLGLKTTDNLNLNVCHFSSVSVAAGDSVARGATLGIRSTSWIHLSLDDRYNSPTQPYPPIPFNGAHTLEGRAFEPGGDTDRDIHDGVQVTSTNGSTGGGGGGGNNGGSHLLLTQAQGFDTCAAPTLSDMKAWHDTENPNANSPYSYVGIYMGGAERACSQPNLTRAWVSELARVGWAFIPIWAGPQPACLGRPNSISTDQATARAQGVNEANLAAAAAASLGLTDASNAGSLIYYDVEAYAAGNASCGAVGSFLDGWTSQLRALGNKAGVYAGACSGMTDVVAMANPPDAAWIASWLGYEYNPNATVNDVGCIDNSAFSNHGRLRQYAGGHDEQWNSVILNIDSNTADGYVVTGTAP